EHPCCLDEAISWPPSLPAPLRGLRDLHEHTGRPLPHHRLRQVPAQLRRPLWEHPCCLDEAISWPPSLPAPLRGLRDLHEHTGRPHHDHCLGSAH
ncbi:hypothetical protein AB0N62_35235, partial [Streptomyces sp. NPDC093982]|uniref:hypothetical protein n=1 Tax=Streptomyces sp. NPDC093982 TaxID=3155077 RepID=UPI003413D628